MTSVSIEKNKYCRALDAARARTHALLSVVDVEEELYLGWTIRHVLAHLTGWDEATSASLRAHATGKEPGTPAYRGIDYYNAQSVAERIDLSYLQILRECEMAREQLKAAIEVLPDEKWDVPILMPWAQTGTVTKLIRIMIHHEEGHATELQNVMEALHGMRF